MRRATLAPPRPPRHGPAAGSGTARRPPGGSRGWLRRAERRLSHEISSKLLYYIPGIHRVYDRLLRRSLTLSRAEIALPGLAAPFDGLRLLLITDVHAGPFIGTRALRETFQRLLACRPDAILLGGDLTGGNPAQFGRHREGFATLRAPLGVFAVLGNHDYHGDRPAPLRSMMDRCGIVLLNNRSVRLDRQGHGLSLAGVDDLSCGTPDLDAALLETSRPVVLLSHNPDMLFEAAGRHVALVLSGHTHGGQVRLPGLGVMMHQSRYRLDEGRYRTGATELVVSRGLGVIGLPLRLGCPPEAVLVTLRKQKGDRSI